MRIFIVYENERTTLDVPEGRPVFEIKKIIEKNVYLDVLCFGESSPKFLALVYGGAELEDDWIFTDVVLYPGATIRLYMKEAVIPALKVKCFFLNNGKLVEIYHEGKIRDLKIKYIRTMIARKTGIPVGAFFISDDGGRELFDENTLGTYDMGRGQTVYMKTWEGWETLLRYAVVGYTNGVQGELSSDEKEARFQIKVAMYIAAHYGHEALADFAVQQGVRACEWTGEHPFRRWTGGSHMHLDCKRSPIHEAAEFGHLSVVRRFVVDDIYAVTARDGNNVMPFSLALRYKHKKCAAFLLSRTWTRLDINGKTVPIQVCARLMAWAEQARVRVWWKHGAEKSSLKKKPFFDPGVLVGSEKINVDGFAKTDTMYELSPKARFRNSAVKVMLRNATVRLRSLVDVLPKAPKSVFITQASVEETIGNKPKSTSFPNIKPLAKNKYRNQLLDFVAKKVSQKRDLVDGLSHSLITDTKTQSDSVKNSNSDKEEIIATKHPETSKAKNEPLRLPPIKPVRRRRRVKAATVDAPMSLPKLSKESQLKPFFRARSKSEDPDSTLDVFEKYRGLPARDYAIKCLGRANRFTTKPWLTQVRIAMQFSYFNVKRASLVNKS
ncbi:protein ANKUB1-like [Lingula anatina]|uniref:Protein ANKUB1-like n=1 Tax=Lingula anatina TaxID=7574 RepID=A0A1S3JB79_LINAN|nr:protein ANKUB1-like [Lingula anatina]|eukprot:XP_013407139.1 protein ANKUB1-like [Lingula anatina]